MWTGGTESGRYFECSGGVGVTCLAERLRLGVLVEMCLNCNRRKNEAFWGFSGPANVKCAIAWKMGFRLLGCLIFRDSIICVPHCIVEKRVSVYGYFTCNAVVTVTAGRQIMSRLVRGLGRVKAYFVECNVSEAVAGRAC